MPASLSARLPRRVPAGTKFVVEGEDTAAGLRIVKRYLVYPDGRRLDLLAGAPQLFVCGLRKTKGTARSRGAVPQDQTCLVLQ